MDQHPEIEKLKEKVATHTVEIAVLQENQTIIKDELKGIRNNTGKMVWILVGGITAGLFALLFNGGI